MNVKIYNLNKLFELRRDNKFYDKVCCGGDACIGFLLIGFFLSIGFIPAALANCFTDASIKAKLLCFLIPIAPFIITHLISYFMSRNVFKDEMEYGVNVLNTPYVNPHNENEIILLHELIKKFDFSEYEADNGDNYDYDVKLKIPVKNITLKRFNDFKYSKPEVKKLLKNHIIPKKKLSESEALSFYNEYINPKISGKNLSFEEKEHILQQLAKLNDVKL